MSVRKKPASNRREPPPRRFLKLLGPGLVTGAADDDPSGIATYSQAGAQYGFGMLWTVVLTYPLMTAIQQISAVIGRSTGHGIAGNLRRHYSRLWMYPLVTLLLVANIINLSADLNAMGAALRLLIGGWDQLYAALFALGSVLVQVRVNYTRYVKMLKWTCLALFAYAATLFVVHIDWMQALHGTVVPHMQWNSETLTILIAIFGTTISPYLFFWQASGEVEELTVETEDLPLRKAPQAAPREMQRIHCDTALGMAFSNLIAWSIIVAVAATLHSHGKTQIETAAQAAESLRPVAGPLASFLFALGIIGTGLLALPVLAGSAAYAVGEALHWPVGLEKNTRQAGGFYGVIMLSTFVAVLLNFTGIDPIKALFWSAVINGVAAVPIMATMMHMVANRQLMGSIRISPLLRLTGWLSTALMAAATFGFFATLRK